MHAGDPEPLGDLRYGPFLRVPQEQEESFTRTDASEAGGELGTLLHPRQEPRMERLPTAAAGCTEVHDGAGSGLDEASVTLQRPHHVCAVA